MSQHERGKKLLEDLAGRVRERTATSTDPALQAQGLAMLDEVAKLLAQSASALPGLRVVRDTGERLRVLRDKRPAEVSLEWRGDAGALALGAERNGQRARSLTYLWREAEGAWRRLEGDGELYEELVLVLTEYLYPEGRPGA